MDKVHETNKVFVTILLVAMITVAVFVPVLVYFFAVDGVVEVSVGDVRAPEFDARGCKAQLGQCQFVKVSVPDGAEGTWFEVTAFRVLFSRKANSYTAGQIGAAFWYGDDTIEDLHEFLHEYGAVFSRSLLVGHINLTELSNTRYFLRVPRGTAILGCVLSVRSVSILNATGVGYFDVDFVTFFGKDDDTKVTLDLLKLHMSSLVYDSSIYSQWDAITTSGSPSTFESYPWYIECSVSRSVHNPYIFDPSVR